MPRETPSFGDAGPEGRVPSDAAARKSVAAGVHAAISREPFSDEAWQAIYSQALMRVPAQLDSYLPALGDPRLDSGLRHRFERIVAGHLRWRGRVLRAKNAPLRPVRAKELRDYVDALPSDFWRQAVQAYYWRLKLPEPPDVRTWENHQHVSTVRILGLADGDFQKNHQGFSLVSVAEDADGKPIFKHGGTTVPFHEGVVALAERGDGRAAGLLNAMEAFHYLRPVTGARLDDGLAVARSFRIPDVDRAAEIAADFLVPDWSAPDAVFFRDFLVRLFADVAILRPFSLAIAESSSDSAPDKGEIAAILGYFRVAILDFPATPGFPDWPKIRGRILDAVSQKTKA